MSATGNNVIVNHDDALAFIRENPRIRCDQIVNYSRIHYHDWRDKVYEGFSENERPDFDTWASEQDQHVRDLWITEHDGTVIDLD